MPEFKNEESAAIDGGNPNLVISTIDVPALDGAVTSLVVSLDIKHTYVGDLNITLYAPSGRGVVLAHALGGAGNDFSGTVFKDDAARDINDGSPPFSGEFRPQGSLAFLAGESTEGQWSLHIADMEFQDGGTLEGWSLRIETDALEASPYRINVDFDGGLSASQRGVFSAAAKRWGEVIRTDHELQIAAKGTDIDGPRGILGQAGPTLVQRGTNFPVRGLMEFDTADLAVMEADGACTM